MKASVYMMSVNRVIDQLGFWCVKYVQFRRLIEGVGVCHTEHNGNGAGSKTLGIVISGSLEKQTAPHIITCMQFY